MIFVKRTLAGLFSLIAVGIVLLFSTGLILNILAPPGTSVGIDIVSVARHSPLVWILAVFAFSLGFYWEYRRLKLRQAK
jgi:hypothetical protein